MDADEGALLATTRHLGEAVDAAQYLEDVGRHRPAGGGESDAATAAVEEAHPEVPLEVGDPTGDRRLCEREFVGGPREALVLGDGTEHLEALEEVHRPVSTWVYIRISMMRTPCDIGHAQDGCQR